MHSLFIILPRSTFPLTSPLVPPVLRVPWIGNNNAWFVTIVHPWNVARTKGTWIEPGKASYIDLSGNRVMLQFWRTCKGRPRTHEYSQRTRWFVASLNARWRWALEGALNSRLQIYLPKNDVHKFPGWRAIEARACVSTDVRAWARACYLHIYQSHLAQSRAFWPQLHSRVHSWRSLGLFPRKCGPIQQCSREATDAWKRTFVMAHSGYKRVSLLEFHFSSLADFGLCGISRLVSRHGR